MEITVLTANGIPARVIWAGRLYRVNDTPTRLSAEEVWELTWHPALTHPLPAWVGWRFQAIDEGLDTFVFDVREGVDGGPWHLLRAVDFDGVKVSDAAYRPQHVRAVRDGSRDQHPHRGVRS